MSGFRALFFLIGEMEPFELASINCGLLFRGCSEPLRSGMRNVGMFYWRFGDGFCAFKIALRAFVFLAGF